jgi:hypothetical protein
MKIKARVIALGHMGDVEFRTLPNDALVDDTKIQEANKIVREEVLKRILDIEFKPSGTIKELKQIIWEIIE